MEVGSSKIIHDLQKNAELEGNFFAILQNVRKFREFVK